jgi:hypothetical protein
MRSILTGTLIAVAVCVVVFATADAARAGQAPPAQDQKPAPKPHDMTGCLAKGDTATTYRLTNVEGGKVKTVDITETEATLKLDPHMGHKVTITGIGISAPKMDAGKKPAGEHYMRVDAVKHVSPTCP